MTHSRHFLVVCKMQCHLVVRKHILYPRFLFFRFLWVSRTCSDFGVKSLKPWEDAPSGTPWIYVAASSQVEPLAAWIQYEGCLTANANAAAICFFVTSRPVFSFEFWIMATLNGFAHRAFKFPFKKTHMHVMELSCKRLLSMILLSAAGCNQLQVFVDCTPPAGCSTWTPPLSWDEETCWTTAGAATCRMHSAVGQLLREVNAAGCCCFSCVDFLNCARLWLGSCCWLLFVPQACVAVTLPCSVCSAAVFNAECSSSCVWY